MNPQQQQAFLSTYGRQFGNQPHAPAQTAVSNQRFVRYGAPARTPPPAAQPSPQTAPPPTYNELPPGATNPQLKTVGTQSILPPHDRDLVSDGFQQVTPRPAAGGPGQFTQVRPTGYTQPVAGGGAFTQVGNLPDSANPQAQAYARGRLAQNGIKVKPGEDAAAMWRNYSAHVAAARAVAVAAGPQAPNDVISPNRPLSAPPLTPTPTTAAPTPQVTPVGPNTLGTRFTRY